MLKFKKYLKWLVLGGLALLNLFVWYVVAHENRHGLLTFAALDVGQGDSLFIEAPNGNQVLIDGGPGQTVLNRLSQVLPFYDRSIDLLVLTHPHADHLEGLLAVLNHYQIGAVIESEVNYPSAAYTEWRRLLKEKNIPVILAARGEQVILDQSATLDILAPLQSWVGHSPTNVHNSMVVSRLTYASTSVMLTGDMEAPLEKQLLADGDNLQSTVLKIGHHGSKTSTTAAFLRAVAPKFAVISVGARNRYGHPAQPTLDTLGAAGVLILRTDESGTIVFKIDKQGNLIYSHK